ncbi:MAG: response regulator [Anaerolineales bacterium]|nr:response regulator [Anaerolineales bacterium]MBP6210118.1 response regulator [Anaerolineales bacterium]
MPELAMIIEDDEDLSEIFGQALTAAHFNVEIVRDGTVAQRRLKELKPDVVILDMHLPNIPGIDLLRQIREDHRLEKTRVVITTADALMGESYRNQADLVLIKPITFTQLRDLTSRLHR